MLVTLLLAATMTEAAETAAAQPARIGVEFQVNSYTTGHQQYAHVAGTPEGGFVVVWKSPGSDFFDNDSTSIQARGYDADGTPLNLGFEVNTYRTGDQTRPRVAVAATGDFMVVWQSAGSDETTNRDTSATSIQGRFYSSTGSPVGGDFQVNSYTTGYQLSPEVTAAFGSEFVVVWTSDGSPADDQEFAVLARRFDGNAAQGTDFQVNMQTTGMQGAPHVAATPDGGFVVVWISDSPPSPNPFISVEARRFAADGAPLGDQFQVNSSTYGYRDNARVAVGSAGEFVVAWMNFDNSELIQARRFGAAGSPIGGEFLVPAATADGQEPDVAVAADGSFVVTWTSAYSTGTDSSFFSVQGRLFAVDGTPLSPDVQLTTYTNGPQADAQAAFLTDSTFVVVWATFDSSGIGSPILDLDGRGIAGQRFDSAGIFFDGFESGNSSAWTTTTP